MKPLLKIFIAFCIVNIVFTMPIPEDEEEDAAGEDDHKEEDAEEGHDHEDGEEGEEEASPGPEDTEEEGTGDSEDGEKTEGDGDTDEKEGEGEDESGEGQDKEGEGEGEGESDGDDQEGQSKEEEEQTDEGKDEGGDEGGNEGGNEGGDKGGDKGGEGKGSKVDTYYKVTAILEKETDPSTVEDTYFRSFVNAELQTRIRNPIVESIVNIEHFSKIEGCFKSLGQDIKKVLQESNKEYKSCTSKEGSREDNCAMQHSNSAGGKLQQITTKVQGCVSKGSK